MTDYTNRHQIILITQQVRTLGHRLDVVNLGRRLTASGRGVDIERILAQRISRNLNAPGPAPPQAGPQPGSGTQHPMHTAPSIVPSIASLASLAFLVSLGSIGHNQFQYT